MSTSGPKTFRIRACLVDGMLELDSGGPLPLADGASFEILVSERHVSDPYYLDLMRAKKRQLVLKEGIRLVAVFSGVWSGGDVHFHDCSVPFDEIRPRIQQQLSGGWEHQFPQLVGLTIGPPSLKRGQQDIFEAGGLWLKIEGGRVAGLEVSSVLLPDRFGEEQVQSLNHALTRISEDLEPRRISHSCNAYQRVYYEESNGYWYPLEWLRDEELHKEEHEIAKAMWRKFHFDLKAKGVGE